MFPRATMIAFVVIFTGLVFLLNGATAQINMCYPTTTRPSLKKGRCYMVTHTYPNHFGLDTVRSLPKASLH